MVIMLFFHNVVKIRNSSNLIKMLKDEEGNYVYDMEKIKSMAIRFYQSLLGSSSHVFSQDKAKRISWLIKKRFSATSVTGMNSAVTRLEIQKVVMSMNKNKAPDPNGFSVGFFQKAWPIIGRDVCDAVLEFFNSGRLLNEVNSIILTLIPKKKNATSMGDYCPISCCNIVYNALPRF
jgi:hypothetical protein